MSRQSCSLAATALLVALAAGCGGGASTEPAVTTTTTTSSATPAAATTGSDWKPSEGCPPVPVPDGDFDLLGDPRACKGGRIVLETNSYPTHMNYYGPERDYNLALEYAGSMFLPLVTVHPNTLQIIPQLAASWEEPEQGRVFVFHIEPDAKWSDGTPVTSKDVLATWDLIMAPEVTEVVLRQELEEWTKPEIVDDKTVRWAAKKASWRNIQVLADIFIYPAHAIDPKTYLDAWKWTPPATCGPYVLGAAEEGKFFTFHRVKDWWGAGKRQFVGLFNFDEVYRKVISDDDISFEAFKRGDIDYYLVTKAQRWVEETEIDKIQKGWIQKQKLYDREPQVPAEMAFNLTDPLFTDVRVRKAMFWLLDRESLHENIFFHQYQNKNSYYANSIYENPNNEKITFNPEKGLALLEEAGWGEKDKDGVRIKDGRRFEFDYIYIHKPRERIYTILQETYRKYGIQMNLKLIQPAAWVKVHEEKSFRMSYANWGPSPFPNPRNLWWGEYADQRQSHNITHFKNAEVDALILQYEAEFDLDKRAAIIRQIDGILYEETPYLLSWYADNWRNLWWDKFGMPSWGSWATIDIRYTCWQTWWWDEGRAKRLEEAMANGTSVPRPPPENTAWKLK